MCPKNVWPTIREIEMSGTVDGKATSKNTVDASEIPNKHLRCQESYNGINYQPQLVIAGFLKHQQYHIKWCVIDYSKIRRFCCRFRLGFCPKVSNSLWSKIANLERTIVTTVVIARGSEIMVARDVPWYFPILKEELGWTPESWKLLGNIGFLSSNKTLHQ